MLESDASMHRGQRGLAGRRHRVRCVDLLGADGDQTYRLATGTDMHRIVQQTGPDEVGECTGGPDGVGVFEVGRDHQDQLGVPRSTQLGIGVRINCCAQCLSQRAVSTEIEHCEVTVPPSDRCRRHHPFPPLNRNGQSGHRRQRFGVRPHRHRTHRRVREPGQIDVAVEWVTAQVTPRVARVSDRRANNIRRQRINKPLATTCRPDQHSGTVRQVGGALTVLTDRKQQRGMGRYLDERPCSTADCRFDSAVETHRMAQVCVPVVAESGAWRHHVAGGSADELHWRFHKFGVRQLLA